MDDLYVECLVERKAGGSQPLIKGVVYGLAAVSLIAGLVINPLFFAVFVGMILCIWLFLPTLNVEFEYLYVSKSLSVDKIFSREKRKKVVEYDLEKMEIFAEEGSDRLDQYKNLRVTERDFTSHYENRPVWVLIVRNGENVERVLLEPYEKLIHAMKSYFPHKTFSRM